MLERSTLFFSVLAVSGAPLALGACSAQRDTTYRGDPLAVLHGTAVSGQDGQPPPLDVALFWYMGPLDRNNPPPNEMYRWPASPTAVSGQFPSAFTIEVLDPPPDSVLVPCGAWGGPMTPMSPARVAIGAVEAMRRDADPSNVQVADIYGWAPEYRVVYTDQDINGDCFLVDRFTRPELARGYHLIRRVPGACQPENDAGPSCGSFVEVPFATSMDLFVVNDGAAGAPGVSLRQTISSYGQVGPFCVLGSKPVATTASGEAACRFIYQRALPNHVVTPTGPQWEPCDQPWLTDVDPGTLADYLSDSDQESTVCQLAQIPPSGWVNGSCKESPQPGWCYVTGAAAGNCGQAVFFSNALGPPVDPTSSNDNYLGNLLCQTGSNAWGP